MLLNKYYTFGEIINIVKEAYLKDGESSFYTDNGWAVYSKNDEMELSTECYIDKLPEINDKYEEVYPDFVRTNSLEFVYSCELLQDTISSALDQKSEVNDEELLNAIKYYDENDDFIEF